MIEEEEQVSETSPSVNNDEPEINELPSKPFRITMELPLFISILSVSLSGAVIYNIILYRTCYHALGHAQTECAGFLSLDKTNVTQQLENEVQKYATFVTTVKSVIEAVAPAILSCFLGVWSDTFGRKPLVVWPLLGMAMSAMLMVVYSMFDNLGPWWYIATAIPYSLSGGFTVLFTGAFCYISDVTSTEKRSLRMTILEAAVSLGSVLGSLASPYLLRAVGNVYLLLITAAINVASYVYTNVFIKESLRSAVSGSLTSVLDFNLVKEMIRECFKRRSNKGRAQILLLTLANSLTVFILYGVMSLEYAYSREKLHWTLSDYSQFSATHTMISFLGAFFGVAVVQKLFKISDLAFTNIAFISVLIEFTAKALATTTWHMYLGAALSMFRGLSSPLIRSLLTKFLPVEDIAKVFALMSAIEGLCPLFSPVMYNSLYEVTLNTFPAAIYVLSIGITAICIICTGFVQYYRWNMSASYQRLNDIDVRWCNQALIETVNWHLGRLLGHK